MFHDYVCYSPLLADPELKDDKLTPSGHIYFDQQEYADSDVQNEKPPKTESMYYEQEDYEHSNFKDGKLSGRARSLRSRI